jgi:uncharacterized Ntn-hydrolase superfamily protein
MKIRRREGRANGSGAGRPARSRLALGLLLVCLVSIAAPLHAFGGVEWEGAPAARAETGILMLPGDDGAATAEAPSSRVPTVATFSIVGFDPETGDLGVAVQSKFFAVGAVVPWARAGVGAVASQAFGNPTFGPRGLDLLEEGVSPSEVLERLAATDEEWERRQVGIVDAKGRSAAHTGSGCMDWAGQVSGANFTAQGNILVSEETVNAMARAYRETEGRLGEKLMRALEEGQKAGGDSRGKQSAAILVVREGGGYGGYDDRYCDLRVDDHPEPIRELRRLFDMWKGWNLIIEGYAHAEKEEWEEAFARGREAIRLEPEKGEPHYHLACYLSLAGRGEDALEELAQAVALEPSLGPRAAKDTDLEPLWEDERFLELTGAGAPAGAGAP